MRAIIWRRFAVISRLGTRSLESKANSGIKTEVPGLSKNVVAVPTEPVGPGAAKNTGYKNPEYFSYNTFSYFEAEVEMAKHRLPQPSSKK